MKFNAFSILFLLAIVVAAPVVDATVCEDCRDILPLRDMSRRIVIPAGHEAAQMIPGGNEHSPQADPVQDICPFCSQSVAAMNLPDCGVPSISGHPCDLPKLLSLSSPSRSIIKPPQN